MSDSLRPGQRVRLHAPSSILRLRSDRGTLVSQEDIDGDRDYWVVRLDAPATLLDHGAPREVSEVCELADNLTALTDDPS